MLIKPGSPWPLPGPTKMRPRWQSWAAWWSSDINDIRQHTAFTAPGGYWARRKDKDDNLRQMHVPLASDIARTSSELMFGAPPTISWDDKTTQDTWDNLAQDTGWANSLLEGGETCSALGGVYWRPQWETAVADYPLLTVVRADEAIPTFRFGRLVSVTFVTSIDPGGDHRGEILRWLEHHEPGQIRHELWRGTADNIGKAVPLAEHELTANLTSIIDTTSIRPTGILVEYTPNNLPQPLDRLPYGKSDFQGIETELDALDEVFDSWMRDIRLAKGRIIVPSEFLSPVVAEQPRRPRFSRQTTYPAKAFDLDREAFAALPGMPGDDGGKAAVLTVQQFAIRFEEHAATAAALIEQAVSRAGYSPQTFGLHVDGELSGTAIRRRERKSHATKTRKRQYQRQPHERLAETMMLINHVVFRKPVPATRATLEWNENDAADPRETAETAELWRRARAMSTQTVVEMAHPDWDDQQVEDEVGRINAENNAPDLTGYEPLTPRDQTGEQGPIDQEDEQQ